MSLPPALSRPGRRALLTAAGGAALLSVAGGTLSPAQAERAARILAGRVPNRTGLSLTVPPVADNPSSVPLTLTVDSPMTEQDHVTALHLVTPENPEPEALQARFTPRSGRAELAIRIRLAGSQTLQAIAEFSDGSVAVESVAIQVVEGGCADLGGGL